MERYVIHITKKCNMACTYCYEKDRESTYSWEEIENLCKNIIESNKNGIHYSIEFLGGEPCLVFNNLKKAVAYFKKNDPEHCDYFIITTNGTIINDDIADFLLKNPDVCFSISLDGIAEANKHRVMNSPERKESYDLVSYNIKCLIKLYKIPIYQLSVHIVTHPLNAKYIYQSIKDIYDMGIRSMSVGTVELCILLSDNYKNTFISEMKKVADNILHGNLKGLRIDLFEDFNTEKPKGRIYIRDKNGKMICESYAEANDDITKTDIYDSVPVSSEIEMFIFNLRKEVCLYYREEKKKCSIQEYETFG